MINILDVIILLFLIMSTVVGFKSGIIKKAVSTIGMVLCLIISYFLKGPIASILIKIFPIYTFKGNLKGLTSLNIILYEVAAFILIFFILMIVYRLLVKLANILEKVLKATIVLSIPSKTLGAIFGFIEMYLILDIVIVILSIPFLNLEFVKTSKLSGFIVNKTPIVSIVTNKITKCFNDINETINTNENENLVNDKIIEILEDYEFVSKETLDKIK